MFEQLKNQEGATLPKTQYSSTYESSSSLDE